MPTHYQNRSVGALLKDDPRKPVLGVVLSVDKVMRRAKTRLGGGASAPVLEIVSQELADQLYILWKSGEQPTVRIEQGVIIKYNGDMPLYAQGPLYQEYRTMGFFAEQVIVAPRLGPQQQPGIPSTIVDITGNCSEAPSATCTFDLTTSYDPASTATWTSIFLGAKPYIAAGGHTLTLPAAPGPLLLAQLAMPTLDALIYLRLACLSGSGTLPVGLTVQLLFTAPVELVAP